MELVMVEIKGHNPYDKYNQRINEVPISPVEDAMHIDPTETHSIEQIFTAQVKPQATTRKTPITVSKNPTSQVLPASLRNRFAPQRSNPIAD